MYRYLFLQIASNKWEQKHKVYEDYIEIETEHAEKPKTTEREKNNFSKRMGTMTCINPYWTKQLPHTNNAWSIIS